MENMPYRPEIITRAPATSLAGPEVVTTDWRQGLPLLAGTRVTLRELRTSDAPSLMAMLTTEEVTRFISPPPSDVPGFERFIEWTRVERAAGRYACFAVVPAGMDDAIGLIQVRQLDPAFATAEWGFAIGSPFWGNGMFPEAARAFLAFVVRHASASTVSRRARPCPTAAATALLRKLGAVQEGVLRKSFLRWGEYHDQVLWSIIEDDWRAARAAQRLSIH